MNQEMEVLKEQSRKVQRQRDIKNSKAIFLFSVVTSVLAGHALLCSCYYTVCQLKISISDRICQNCRFLCTRLYQGDFHFV